MPKLGKKTQFYWNKKQTNSRHEEKNQKIFLELEKSSVLKKHKSGGKFP